MAAVDVVGGGTHPLGRGPLQVWVDGLVVVAHDVPGRLRPPGDTGGVAQEQVRGRGVVGRIDQLLLFLGQVTAEAADARRLQPHAPVGDVDLGEDRRRGVLVLLALGGLGLVGAQGADVHQPGHAVIGARGGDDGAAVGVADQDGRAVDPAQGAPRRGDVFHVRIEAVLRGHHLIPLRLKRRDHLAETRAVCPDPVAEHDARLGWRGHDFLLNCVGGRSGRQSRTDTSVAGRATAIPHTFR